MVELSEKFNYCLIEYKNNIHYVTFYEHIDDVKVRKELTLLYNVERYIADDHLIIKGVEDEVHWIDHIKGCSELKHQPQKKYIKYDKGINIFGKTFFDTPCYVKDYYRTEPIHKVKYHIPNNYVIKYIY